MDTARLINSSFDGIPRFSLANHRCFSPSERAVSAARLSSPKSYKRKTFLQVPSNTQQLGPTLQFIYTYMYTLFYTTHKCRRCIYLLSCFSSSFSISFSVYVTLANTAPRCGDYITARATVRKNPPADYISPSVLHVARFATLGISRTITDGTADREPTSQRTRPCLTFDTVYRAVTPCTRSDYHTLRLSTQQWLTTTRPDGARVPSLCCGMQRSRQSLREQRRIYPCTTMARQLVNTQLNVNSLISRESRRPKIETSSPIGSLSGRRWRYPERPIGRWIGAARKWWAHAYRRASAPVEGAFERRHSKIKVSLHRLKFRSSHVTRTVVNCQKSFLMNLWRDWYRWNWSCDLIGSLDSDA